MAKGDTGINIARAFVEIVPSTKGVGKAICSAFANASQKAAQTGTKSGVEYAAGFARNTASIGRNISQNLLKASVLSKNSGVRSGVQYAGAFTQKSSGIGQKLQSVFSRLTILSKSSGMSAGASFANGFGAKLGVISGVVQSITGRIVSAFSGISQEIFEASDSAQKFGATLKFAGISTKQISKLTKATQLYADKTVYDLNDIRSTTAQLASNGVKHFDKLAEAAGNLNAIAGGNKETFKSVAMVLTQTAGAGKLTADNWRQLSQAIPGASGKIQEQLKKNGVYTGNFADAMRQGKITSEAFNKALLDLGFNDVAVKAAQSTATIEGAWGNLQASVVKAGMVVFDSIKAPVTQTMSAIADAIGNLTNAIQAPLSAAISGVIDWFGKLFTAMQNVGVIESFKAIWQSLCDVFVRAISIKGSWDGFIPPESVANGVKSLLDGFNRVLQVVKELAPAIIPALSAWAAYKTAVTLATAAQTALDAAMDANPVGAVAAAVTVLVGALTLFFTQTKQGQEAWSQISSTFSDFASQLAPSLNDLFAQLCESFGNLGNAFKSILTAALPLLELFVKLDAIFIGYYLMLLNIFIPVLAKLVQALSGVAEFITGVFTLNWNTAWKGICDVFQGNLGVIITFAAKYLEQFKNIWATVLNFLQAKLQSALQTIQPMWNNALLGIKRFFEDICNGIKSSAKSGVDAAYRFVTGIKGRVIGFFAGAGQWLVRAGYAIISGLLNGLQSKFAGVQHFVSGIGSWIAQHKGPISYDKKLLIPAGNAIMQGFSKGLGESWQGVQKQVAGFTKQSGNWFNDANAIRLRTTVMPPDGGWNAQQNQIAKVAANYEVDASRTGLTKQDLYDAFDGVMSQGVALKLNGRGGEVMAGILAKPMNNELNKMATLGR